MAQPRTAFTFAVLDQFHQLTLQGKTTAWDFYNALAHVTDNTGLASFSVSLRYIYLSHILTLPLAEVHRILRCYAPLASSENVEARWARS